MKSERYPAFRFEQLTKPLVAALRFAYDLKRKNPNHNIPWTGPDINPATKLSSYCPDMSEQFKRDSLRYANERDRDAAEHIISTAVQLGIEQGMRIAAASQEGLSKPALQMLKGTLRNVDKLTPARIAGDLKVIIDILSHE